MGKFGGRHVRKFKFGPVQVPDDCAHGFQRASRWQWVALSDNLGAVTMCVFEVARPIKIRIITLKCGHLFRAQAARCHSRAVLSGIYLIAMDDVKLIVGFACARQNLSGMTHHTYQ